MSIAPPALITGAARLALLYGLFSTFSLRSGADRWESGVSFEAASCDGAGGVGELVCDPTNEVQRVTESGAGLTSFTLTYAGQTTGSIAAAASAATVQAALIALSNVGPADVAVTGADGGPYTVMFGGTLADTNVTAMTATPTGGTGAVTVTTVTSGVPPTVGLPKDLASNLPGFGIATPFTVYGHFTCSPVGWPPDDAQARAEAHLLNREEARVEQALWTGDLGNAPALQDPDTTVVDSTAVTAKIGLGDLENFVASAYGSTGVIHMTRGTALSLLAARALETKGGLLTTALGTPVAAGAGYPGTGPTGQAAATGTAWVYASPALFGYRSDVFTSSSVPGDLLDRARNDLYAVAERNYLLGFDPCGVGAALVSLG